MPKQQRTLIPFLVFLFPKCVSGKILSFNFLLSKNTNQKLDFKKLEIKQAKRYNKISKSCLDLYHWFKKLKGYSRCLRITRDWSTNLVKLYLEKIKTDLTFSMLFFLNVFVKIKNLIHISDVMLLSCKEKKILRILFLKKVIWSKSEWWSRYSN